MAKIYLVYSNSRTPLSPVIRWRTGAEYSHIGIILEQDSRDITDDSFVSHSSLATLRSFKAAASNGQITELDCDITREQYNVLSFLVCRYEGKPYDLEGAIGLGVNEDWQDDDKFWCSEWVAFLLKQIGMPLEFLENEHRITPAHNLKWKQTILSKF